MHASKDIGEGDPKHDDGAEKSNDLGDGMVAPPASEGREPCFLHGNGERSKICHRTRVGQGAGPAKPALASRVSGTGVNKGGRLASRAD